MSICEPCRAGADILIQRPLDDRAQKVWQDLVVSLPVLTVPEYSKELHALCRGCPCKHSTAPSPVPLSSAEMT